MPKINPYYIPKENVVKTEQIIYLDQNYQPQSYEEFMKTYEPNQEVELITEVNDRIEYYMVLSMVRGTSNQKKLRNLRER